VQLEQIQVVVYPRNPWEAIDLGFSMVQQWWQPLAKIWLATILPLVIMIYVLSNRELWLASWIVWWLKPLFDRWILYFFSRALFGETVSIKQLWQQLPNLLFKTHLFRGLTWDRLTLIRSFKLPISQLEGLTGQLWRQRLKILQTKTLSYAQWLTVVCVGLEWIVYLSLCFLLYLMMPVTAQIELKTIIYNIETAPWWIEINRAIFYCLALSLVEILYVASGFALYLNRRTHLEGWDIELSFRRLAADMTKMGISNTTHPGNHP